MSTFLNATVRDGVLKGGHCYDYAKRQQKPQSGRQLVGTVGLVDGCGSDRDRPRIAIRLVTRARGRLGWRPQTLHCRPPRTIRQRRQQITLVVLAGRVWSARRARSPQKKDTGERPCWNSPEQQHAHRHFAPGHCILGCAKVADIESFWCESLAGAVVTPFATPI